MLRHERLNPAFAGTFFDSMMFLRELGERFPEAISFALGFPNEALFESARSLRSLEHYLGDCSRKTARSPERTLDRLCQYGRTSGFIHSLVAEMLERDHGVYAPDQSIVITAGGQEAMLLCVATLCRPAQDVILVSEPTYFGVLGAARILGVEVRPVVTRHDGVDLAELGRMITDIRGEGKQPRFYYEIPDFSNPSGRTLPLDKRLALLSLCDREDVLILEDAAYTLFAYDGEPPPPLKALEGGERVIFLTSFSKSVYPGIRLAALVADQEVTRSAGKSGLLADELSRIKSFVSMSSSSISQAILAGILLESGGSLKQHNRARVAFYRRNRDLLVERLSEELGGLARSLDVQWNAPAGGFFVLLTLPFDVDDALLAESAREHGVVWVPMRHFHAGTGGERQMRLSFSNVGPDEIVEGIKRLRRLIERHLVSHRA